MQKYWKILPFLALLVLYGGSIIFRPLVIGTEIYFASLAEAFSENIATMPSWQNTSLRYAEIPMLINGAIYKLLGGSAPALRVVPMLSVLGTALLLYLQLRRQSHLKALSTSVIFATTPIVFFGGTSLNSGALALFAFTFGCWGLNKTESDTKLKMTLWDGIPAISLALGAAIAGPAAAVVLLVYGIFSPMSFYGAIVSALVSVAFYYWETGLPIMENKMFPLSILFLGTMPWMLFFPVVAGGVRNWIREQENLRTLLCGITAWIMAIVVPESFPFCAMLGVSFFAQIFAALLTENFATLEGIARYNRQIRTISLIFCTGLIALVLVQSASRFISIDTNLILYGAKENWLMSLFAMAIPLMWWLLSRKEEKSEHKIIAFGVGCAFLLLATSTMLPARIVAKYVPEPLFKSHLTSLITPDSVVLADAKFAPSVYRLFKGVKVEALPKDRDQLKTLIESRQEPVLLLLDGYDQWLGMPVPDERYWFKNSSLYILDYKK